MITEFKDNFSWLSNFSPVRINLNGLIYCSVEHAYMSEKSDDVKWKLFCSDDNNSASLVKRRSKDIKLKDNWNQLKLDVMLYCIREKFKQEPYKTKLIETGDDYLQEGNYWNDKFWGICLKTNSGKNHLGKIIMKVRREINPKRGLFQ